MPGDIIYKVNDFIIANDILKFEEQINESLFNNKELSIDFEFLSEEIICCNIKGCKHHPGLPLIETYEKIFGERNENMEFPFGTGAQFIVSKKNILQRPKEFYLKIIEMLDKDIKPIEGYVIERFHKLIFT